MSTSFIPDRWLCWTALWEPARASSGMEQALILPGFSSSTLFSYDDDGTPFRMEYQLRWNEAWEAVELHAEVWAPSAEYTLHLQRTPTGFWLNTDGVPFPGSGGLLDLDIWPTPWTNTLSIRRLTLEVGASQEITPLWVQAPTLNVSIRRQIYARLSDSIYRFTSPDDNFQADLKVDETGIVVEYPGLFQLI